MRRDGAAAVSRASEICGSFAYNYSHRCDARVIPLMRDRGILYCNEIVGNIG